MRQFDILLIVPLEQEMAELLRIFTQIENLSTPTQMRYALELPNGLTAVSVLQEQMGYLDAIHVCHSTWAEFKYNLVICCGIAGSISKDLSLGDVCYSGTIIDVYNNAKIKDDADRNPKILFQPQSFKTPTPITSALNFSRIMPEIKHIYKDWQDFQELIAEELVPIEVLGREGRPEKIQKPKSLNGQIICSQVVTSKSYIEQLKQIDRSALAVETESGGIFDFAEHKGIAALSIRGISDYADVIKENLELNTGSKVRELAANNAFSFLKSQLHNLNFSNSILNLRKSNSDGFEKNRDLSKYTIIIDQLIDDIDKNLRDRIPIYRSKPKGYKLPTPRLKKMKGVNFDEMKYSKDDFIEFSEFKRLSRFSNLNVPGSYPDRALPWLLAQSILDFTVDDKQMVPIVVPALEIKYPKKNLAHFSSQLDNFQNIDCVYIVDGINELNSRQRILLKNDIEILLKYSYVIVINYDEDKALYAEQFSLEFSGASFTVEGVSFSSITSYVRSQYSLDDHSAEVLAYRMQSLCDDYGVPAHPSFFGGISEEALQSLLSVNSRAELVELAVLGYLSLVVALDKNKIRVKRSTRYTFLEKLVSEIEVRKKNLDRVQLVDFVQSFCSEFDLEIDPYSFIDSFIKSGVLFFSGNRVAFNLPFIKSYMLASYLKSNTPDALIYLDPIGADWDGSTFDMYAEVSGHLDFVELIMKRIDGILIDYVDNDHDLILLSDKIQANIIEKGKMFKGLERRLKDEEGRIASPRSEVSKKQEIIDAMNSVSKRFRGMIEESDDTVGSKDKSASGGQVVEHPIAFSERIERNLAIWHSGVVLLGSGSEKVRAEQKKTLAIGVLAGASAIVDELTKKYSGNVLIRLKEEVKSEKLIDELMEMLGNNAQRQDAKQVIETMYDNFEMGLIGSPLIRILDTIEEKASQLSLASTLLKIRGSNDFEEIIRIIWLASIDSSFDINIHNKQIDKVSKYGFLRIMLVTHLLIKTYWSIPSMEVRRNMLAIANRLLKPMKIKVPEKTFEEITNARLELR